MARRLAVPSKELQLQVIGPKDVFKASRVQRLSIATNIPITNKDELGNPQHAGQTKDTPDITLSFQAFDVGVNIFAALTGTPLTAYPSVGVDISNLGEMDAVVFVKDSEVADYVKSFHGRRLQIRDFVFNYSVGGDSTEDYTAIGSEKRWLKYDVVIDKFTTGTTTFILSQTPIVLKNTNYALTVTVDGEYVKEVTTAPATGEYRLSGGSHTTLTTGDTRTAQVIAVYHANPTGSNWSDVRDTATPASIIGKDVKVKISANSIDRVQSISINGNMNTQPVKELGNKQVVGYQRQVPTVTGTITVLDTDTDLISLLTYGTVGSGVEWQPGEGCSDVTLDLEIQLLDPCDDTVPYTILKTIYIPGATVAGDTYTANVNNNATQAFNFNSTSGQCLIFSGARS